MNAYQILGIMSHIDNEMDENSANEKIMNKVKKQISFFLMKFYNTDSVAYGILLRRILFLQYSTLSLL